MPILAKHIDHLDKESQRLPETLQQNVLPLGMKGRGAAKVIVRLVEGAHLIRREEMAEVHLTGQHHARAVGLFETSLNHRTSCCKSLGIGVPVFLPSIRAHWAVMSAIVY